MAQTIKLKRSGTSGAIPTTSQLELGEVAINTYDGKMYIKKNVGGTETIVEIGSGATSADAIFEEYIYTATSAQTSFSGSDDNSLTLSYTAGAIQVFLNGVLLDPDTDYTATNGTTVVLASGATASDLLQIFAFKKKIGDGQTTVDTFTGNNSTTAFTLSLDPGDENNTRVYIDGVYQSKSNYSVSGTTLTFSTAPPTGTAIEVEIGNRVVTLDTLSDLDLPDNVKLRIGTSQDLEIFHNGTDSVVNQTGTGDLLIQKDETTVAEFDVDGLTVTGDVEADEFIGDVRGAVLFKAQAGETLAKGDVVYISGISGNTTIVSKADADDASKMPAFGLVAAAASSGNPVDIYTNGILSGIDTSSYSEGDELFVSTTAGTLTATAPTGESAALQKIGKVTRSASSGSIFIVGAGRSNAVPNLNDGDIFIGNGSNQATTASLNTKIESYLDGGTSTPQFSTVNSGNITTTGEIRGPATFVIDPAAVGDNTGTVQIKGNLQVDGTQTIINSTTLTVDDLNITLASGAANATAANGAGITIDGASATLTYDSSNDTWDFNKGIDVTGTVTADGLDLGDSEPIRLGASQDLQLYHDGSNSYIYDAGTGYMVLMTDGPGIRLNKNNAEVMLDATPDGAVSLYYDNAVKIATTATGIDVTGTVTADGLTVDGTATIDGASGIPLTLDADAGANTNLQFNQNGSLRWYLRNVTSSNDFNFYGNSQSRLNIGSGGDISFYDTSGNAKFFWDSSAESLGIGTSSINSDSILHLKSTQPNIYFEDTDDSKSWRLEAGAVFKLQNITTSSEVFRMDQSGNVGIGLSSGIGSKLHVNTEISIGADGDNRGIVGYTPNRFYIGTRQSGTNYFDTVSVSGGNVGIGGSPDTKLHLIDGGTPELRLESTDASVVSGQSLGDITWESNDVSGGGQGVRAKISALAENAGTIYGLAFYTGTGANPTEKFRIANDGSISTPTAGTGNVRFGVNAGKSFTSSGNYNVVVGDDALDDATSASNNVAVGYGTMADTTSGSNNVAVGYQSLLLNQGGSLNVAVGSLALDASTSGTLNVGVGAFALSSLTTSAANVAVGYAALEENTTGANNTAVGYKALEANTTANHNVAIGYQSLNSDTKGTKNVAVGAYTLENQNFTSNTDSYNTAIGYFAGRDVTTGVENTLVGGLAGDALTSSNRNTVLGYAALSAETAGQYNTAIGYAALLSQNNSSSTDAYNTAVGYAAGAAVTTGTQNTLIGALAGDAMTNATRNVAVGYAALTSSTASDNTAVGWAALNVATSGNANVAVGRSALGAMTTGGSNIAVGYLAADAVTSGNNNVVVGNGALGANQQGDRNIAIGNQALAVYNPSSNEDSYNVAIGHDAGQAVTTGNSNTIVGGKTGYALTEGFRNTFIGRGAGNSTTTGLENTYVGRAAGENATGSRNTYIGEEAAVTQTSGDFNCYVGTYSGSSMTTGAKNTILGRYNGNQNNLDIRTSSNNIVLSDGDGNHKLHIRHITTDTATYRLSDRYHGFGYVYNTGTIASGSSTAININSAGNDGSVGLLAVATRWSSVDGGDSVRLYAHSHGQSYNSYTSLHYSSVNSITITESGGSVTISNGSSNELKYQIRYLNYATGETIRNLV